MRTHKLVDYKRCNYRRKRYSLPISYFDGWIGITSIVKVNFKINTPSNIEILKFYDNTIFDKCEVEWHKPQRNK